MTKFTAVMGALFAAIGTGMVTHFQVDTGLPFIIVTMFIIGTGLGFMSTSFVIAVQNAVPWNLRGVATASTQFVRTMGGTVGVAVMGTILNAQMALHFVPIFAHYASVLARLPQGLAPSNVLLTPDVQSTLPDNLLNQLQLALAQSLFWIYAFIFVFALIGLATMFFLPGGKAEQYSYKSDEGESAQLVSAKFEPEITSIG